MTKFEEQVEQAAKLLRYAHRLCPADAATANAILATLEPEAVQQGKDMFRAEQAKLEEALQRGGNTLPMAIHEVPRSARRGHGRGK